MKRILLSFLQIGLLSFVCQQLSAHDFEVDGIYYSYLSQEDKTVSVTYKGYYSYSYSNEYSGNVVIPESVTYQGTTYSVTSIGEEAFRDCTGLTSIEIPNSVTSIGKYAFYGCTGLTSINIPNSVTSIGDLAFYGCTRLTSINIPNSVTSIGSGAFWDCTELTSIIVDANNSVYDSRNNCNAIIETSTNTLIAGCKNTIIPNSVTSIGKSAFYGCTGLTNINIPNSVTSIGRGAFYECTGLTNIVIPSSVTSIGGDAFYNTGWYNNQPNGLVYAGKVAYKYKGTMPENTSIVLKDGTTEIAGSAFYKCTGLTSIEIPNSVTSIGESAFRICTGLTSINIPNSVTSIGDYTFYNCAGLTNFVIPNSVTSIGSGAFNGCTRLTSINIPNSVTSIGEEAFSGCSNLQYNKYDNALYLGNLENPFVVLMKAQDKNVGACVIADNCKFIYKDAFYGCTGLSDIIIPKNVTSIGGYAFKNCNNLKKVYNNSALTLTPGSSIYGYVAYYAEVVYNNCRLDGDYVITYVNDIPYVCGYLGQDTELTLPAMYGIGDYAFYDCKDLINVSIPNGVKSIGENAFSGCTGLTSIELPNSVTSIDRYAFYGCSGLTSIEIPNSVTSIGYYAFYGCSGTLAINCDIEDAENSNEGWFYGSMFSKVILGETVNKVGKYAFYGLTSIKSLTIGGNVNRIDYYAFDNCTGLKSIYSNAVNPPACRDNAFHGDTKWDCPLYVPKESLEAYKAANVWKSFLDIKENPYYSSLESIATMDKNDAPLYDLQGTQVVAPRPNGLYIRDGKKIILK